MLVDSKQITQYLEDFKEGRISQGLGIGVKEFDYHLRFKKGSFNMILGHDNVGKTYWRTWYYLVLSVQHGCKWCIWTGENKAGQVVRNLIQFLSGRYIKDLTMAEIYRYEQEIAQWFKFVDNAKVYKYKELLKIFDGDYTGCLIDPYTGLDRDFAHSDNYRFLNETRHWVNSTGITIDVCTHPISSSARAGGMYPEDHSLKGHLKAPFKGDTEGGKPFGNRTDDFIIIHRLSKHPEQKTFTRVSIDKIRDHETGGEETELDMPILFDFNKGLGFTINNINPIHDNIKEQKLPF